MCTVAGPCRSLAFPVAAVVSGAPTTGWLCADDVAVAVIRILRAVKTVVDVSAVDVVRF